MAAFEGSVDDIDSIKKSKKFRKKKAKNRLFSVFRV